MRTFLLCVTFVLATAPANANTLKTNIAKQITAPIQISSCRASSDYSSDRRPPQIPYQGPMLVQSTTPGGTYIMQPNSVQLAPNADVGDFAATSIQATVSFKNLSSVNADAVGVAFQLVDFSNHPIKTFTAVLEDTLASGVTDPREWNTRANTLAANVASMTCSVIYAKFANGTVWGATPK